MNRNHSPEQWTAQPISPEKNSGRRSPGCLAGLVVISGLLLVFGFGALYLLRNPQIFQPNNPVLQPVSSLPVLVIPAGESAGLTPISGVMPPTWTPQSDRQNYMETPQATQSFTRIGTHTPYPSAVSFTQPETETAGIQEINPQEYDEISLNLLLEYPAVYINKKLKIEGQIITFGEVTTPDGLQFGVQIIPINKETEEESFWTPVLVLNLPPDPLFELNKPLRIYAVGMENENNIQVQELYWNAPILLAASYQILD